MMVFIFVFGIWMAGHLPDFAAKVCPVVGDL